MREILYDDCRTVLRGELIEGPPGPGVVVVHGGAGLDEHARTQARRIAALGCTVLAADLYGPGVTGDRERVLAAIGALRGDPGGLVRRASAALGALAALPGVDNPITVVGYCLGGHVALELARAGAPIAGAVSVHGTLAPSRPARPGALHARILACHGGSDPHVPASEVAGFQEEMTAADADWQLLVLGGAQHGFTHDPAAPPAPGVAHDAAADARSFTALRCFLAEVWAAHASPR